MDIKKILNSLGIESKNYGAEIGGEWLKKKGDGQNLHKHT